jgi:hypothetical protein
MQNANPTSGLTQNIHTTRSTPRWPPRPTEAAQQNAPSSEVRLARGSPPLSSEVYASLERGPPRLRFPHERTYSRTRVRVFNALTRQSCATTRLGITPRCCSANSLGGAHPRHCGELCDEAGVSSVTLCRPLLYG